MRAKLINFERGIDPKDSMNIGLPGIRAMSRMKPGVIYRTEEKRWYYYYFFKNPEDNEIYYSFSSSRKVIHAYRFLSKHKPQDFPLDLTATGKHFDKFLPKLTFVDESVNFERGGDPKDTIQIGRKHIWNMTGKELAEHILDNVSNKVRPILDRNEAAIIEAGFENVETYRNYIYDYFDSHDEFPKVSKEIDDSEQELEEAIKTECLKYPVKPGVNPNNEVSYMEALVSNLFTLMLEGGPHGTYVNLIESSLDPDYLKESVNFERGVEPRKSMNVGMAKVLPKVIEELLRYDEENGQDILREIRFYRDGVEFACSVDRSELSDKQRVNYVRELIVKFRLDPFIVLKPVKFYRPMGIANFIFELTEEGKKVNPKKRFYLHMSVGKFTAEDNKITSFVEDYLYAKTLQEAYNFERGINPKKALGIGQKEMKKKLIGILPDLSNSPLWDEMYKKIIDGIKREDTIVTISDDYIIVKSPVLTWRFADNLRIMINMSSKKVVELEKKPSINQIYLRGPEWMIHDYKTPRVYKYQIL